MGGKKNQMKKMIHILSLSFLIPLLVGAQTATITVTRDVIRSADELEPLGLNRFGDVGGMSASSGNIIEQGGFEPVSMRDLYHVIECGQDKGHYWVTLDGAGTSKWLRYDTGAYSGARLRAYRFLDADGNSLPYRTANVEGGKMIDTKNVAQVKPLFDSRVLPKGTPDFPDGGWLADSGVTEFKEWQAKSAEEKAEVSKGWRMYYEADVPLQMDDVIIVEKEMIWPDPEDFHPRMQAGGIWADWKNVTGTSRIIPVPEGMPEGVDFGKGIGRVTPQNGEAELWYKMFCATGMKNVYWYGMLDEGVKYRFEAWVKMDGGTGGSVHLGFGENKPGSWRSGYFGTQVGQDFPVSDKWSLIGFEFTAPVTPEKGGIEGAILRYIGDRDLLVDNVKLQPVYEPGDEDKPFVINQKLFEALMDNQPATGRKGALRSWAGLCQAPMDDLLRWSTPSQLDLRGSIAVRPVKGGPMFPKMLTILEATGDSPETRMVPWLMGQVTHSPEEYRQLVEYLAAPYDPAVDTPESKPYAYRRTLQRGHNRPWIEDFREIIIEFGNENWHNRRNEEWIGVGRSGLSQQCGPEMGVFTRYLVEEMRQSPYWDEENLKICVGGNYTAGVNADGSVKGYGQEAVQKAGDTADHHSHATYVGPRWETGESSQTSIDDAGVQKTLLAYRPVKEQEWKLQEEAHEQLKKLGFDVEMTAYESGPSGFGLRAKTPEEDRAGEYYGKSFAMGTAVLDAWLDAWKKGWTYQCYLNFGQGKWWNSHTSMAEEHRPSPGFLIQTLINQTVANRDMLTTTVTGSPSREYIEPPPKWNKKAQPVSYQVETLQAHSFGDDETVVVAVSNLNLDQAQLVEIKIPLKKVSSIELHTLTGDPRDTNLDERKVELTSSRLPASQFKNGVLKTEVPAGSPAVFMFNK
jgi:hypothetical protein